MALYELTVDGKPVERVRPVPDSENERQLAEKAAARKDDKADGWAVVNEDAEATSSTGEAERAPAEDAKPATATRAPKGPNATSGDGGEGK